MISEEQLVMIRQKADIVDIISGYISLTKKGKNYVAFCPFHNDKNHPSMVVSKEKQIFNCFSCKNGGNVFSFVSKYENVNFYEAVRIVASKVGIELSNNSSYVTNNKYDNLYKIYELSKKYYLNNINTKSGLKAKEYLLNRGIDDGVIKDFSIGLSLSDKDDLYNFLKSQNIEDDEMIELGLINRFGLDIFDSFKNRIMIPITNLQNQVVGFTGRIYNGEDEAKYINTKETVIFKKSNILFNYANAKNSIREAKKIIIVEGNMDAIKMHASGIKNVVALMGTFISKEHIDVLKKLNSKIILMLDNDEAGYNATIKNGDLLLENNIICDVIRLSGAKDPDEYIFKNGVDSLIDNINHPINYIDFKIDDLKKTYDLFTSMGVASFVKEIINLIKYMDTVTKSVIINKVSLDYNIDKSLFKEDKKEDNKLFNDINYYDVTGSDVRKDKYEVLSNKIFYYLISEKKYLDIYKSKLNFFRNKDQRELLSYIESFYKGSVECSLADLLSTTTGDEKINKYLLEIIASNADEEVDEIKFLEYLILMQKKIVDMDIDDLKYKIKNELDVGKKVKLIEDLTRLKKGSVDYE